MNGLGFIKRLPRKAALAATPVAFASLLVFMVSGGISLAATEAPPAITQGVEFVVKRGSSDIGTHRVSFREQGDELHVAIDIDLEITFGFLTLFEYQHRNREVWRDGRLVSLETWTNDDGTRYAVSARATDAGLEVEGADGRFVAPADIIPTSYWNPDTVTRSRLLDTQRGRIIDVEVSPAPGETVVMLDGGTVPSKKYDMTGDLRLHLWYSDQGEWLKVAFDARGADVAYEIDRLDRDVMQRVAAR